MKDDTSVIDVLDRSFQLYPDKDYLFDVKSSITYSQLYQEAYLLSAGLYKLGVRKGDRVLVCLPNWHEFVAVFFSLARIGAIIIPCNPCYHKEDIKPILEDGKIKAVFLPKTDNLTSVFHEAGIKIIVTVRHRESGCIAYDSLLDVGEQTETIPTVPINAENDVMAILYSSGTTGKPKGVMLTHQNLLYATKTAEQQLLCTHEDVIFTPVPVFHIFGIVPGILLTVLTGAKIIFMEKFQTMKALQLMEKGKATIHLGVPTMFIFELNKLKESGCKLTSLRTGIIAGSHCPSNVVRMIRTQMGCNVKISYGMTETSSAITFTSFSDDEKICSETVGRAVEGTEIKIVNEQYQEVSIGEIGELACRGKGLMRGYYNMPEKTSEVIDHDGWYYTGDLATVNQDGYYTIVGRKKDMIIRGGYKIYPREIEEILYEHVNILDVAIVGMPDPVFGETSCAFIKLKPDCIETEASIKEFLNEKVVKYKVPDQIMFLKDFPLNPSGKIKKNALKEIAMMKNETMSVGNM